MKYSILKTTVRYTMLPIFMQNYYTVEDKKGHTPSLQEQDQDLAILHRFEYYNIITLYNDTDTNTTSIYYRY
jgi:hypothetical protein